MARFEIRKIEMLMQYEILPHGVSFILYVLSSRFDIMYECCTYRNFIFKSISIFWNLFFFTYHFKK